MRPPLQGSDCFVPNAYPVCGRWSTHGSSRIAQNVDTRVLLIFVYQVTHTIYSTGISSTKSGAIGDLIRNTYDIASPTRLFFPGSATKRIREKKVFHYIGHRKKPRRANCRRKSKVFRTGEQGIGTLSSSTLRYIIWLCSWACITGNCIKFQVTGTTGYQGDTET